MTSIRYHRFEELMEYNKEYCDSTKQNEEIPIKSFEMNAEITRSASMKVKAQSSVVGSRGSIAGKFEK